MPMLTNASGRSPAFANFLTWRRLVAAFAFVALLALLIAVPASQGADDDVMLYPIAPANFGRVLRVSGIADPGQAIRIEANKVVVARTVANRSGDFAVVFTPRRGMNEIRAIEDSGLYPSQSGPYRVRHDPPRAFDKPANGGKPADGEKPDKPRIVAFLAIAAPVLTAPASTTSANPITISGTAPAGTEVSFFVNGRYTRKVVASGGGTFSTWVPLEDGLNSIYATASDGVDISPVSNTVQTTYTNSISRTYSATTISTPTVWTKGSAPTYTLNGTLTINSSGALWIQPGVILSVTGNYKVLASSGELAIRGTSSEHVLLRPSAVSCTDSTPRRNDWSGIEVTGTAGRASTEYADVYCANNGIYFNGGTGSLKFSRFVNGITGARTKGGSPSALVSPLISGGNEFRGSTNGMYVDTDSRPTISGGNVFTGNTNGIYIEGNATASNNPLPVINGNSLYGNSSDNLYSGNFNINNTVILDAKDNWWGSADPSVVSATIRDRKDSTYAPYVDFTGFLDGAGGASVHPGPTLIGPVSTTGTLTAGTYLVLSDVLVNAGVTWTLPAGTTLLAVPGRRMLVNGTLVATGSSGQRVRFTSSKPYPAKGDWAGLEVGATGSVSLDYTRIEYATNGVYFNAGQGSVTHSLIRFCAKGVFVGAKSNPTINSANEISNNDYGIYVQGDSVLANHPAPVANGNSLFANAQKNYYAIGYTTPKPTLDATGNWWGTSVPANITASIYTGAGNSPLVNSSGYLSSEPFAPAMHLNAVAMSVQQAKPLVSTQLATGAFTINRGGTVDFTVRRDNDNAIVRQWSQVHATPGTYAFTWDGLDGTSAVVTSGLYRVIMDATDGADDFYYDAPVPTGNNYSEAASTRPTTYRPLLGALYKMQVDIPNPSVTSFEITPSGGTPFYAFKDVFYPAGEHWFYWDGRDPTGALLTGAVNVWAHDGIIMRPNGVYVFGPKVTITGPAAAPNIDVRSDPYWITSSYEQASRIVYRVSQDATVRVTMLPPGINDPAHASAIVLVNNVFQPAKDGGGVPIDYTVEWTGYNPADPNAVLISTEGAYTFAIEATIPSTSYKSVYRGVLNVVQ